MKYSVGIVIAVLALTIAPTYAAGKHVRELPQHTILEQGFDAGAHLPAVGEVRDDIAALQTLRQQLRETQDPNRRRDLLRQYQLAMGTAMAGLRGHHSALARDVVAPVTAPATTLLEHQHRIADQLEVLQQLMEEMMAFQFALLGL